MYTVDAKSIYFKCQRWWRTDPEDVDKLISFNLTWVLPPYIGSGHVISNFVVNLKLINIVEDSKIPVQESITVNFHEVYMLNTQYLAYLL